MVCGFTQSDHKINEELIDFDKNKYFLLLARGTEFTGEFSLELKEYLSLVIM